MRFSDSTKLLPDMLVLKQSCWRISHNPLFVMLVTFGTTPIMFMKGNKYILSISIKTRDGKSIAGKVLQRSSNCNVRLGYFVSKLIRNNWI